MFFPDARTLDSSASICFGQSGLTQSGTPLISASQVAVPTALWVTQAGDLFIAQEGTERISLFFQGGNSPTQNDIPANVIFGQPNSTITVSGVFLHLNSLFFDEETGNLWAVDSSGNTIVRFTNALIQTAPVPTATASVSFPDRNPNALFAPTSKNPQRISS